nr:hypothetical protein [Tanacetum cinerariifolium]
HIIVAGSDNRSLILEKSMYDSWASHIRLFIKEKKHGRMMLDSIDNGLLVYLTVKENRQTRPKKYFELTEVQQLQDDCDVLSNEYHSSRPSTRCVCTSHERNPDSLAFVANSPTLYNTSQSPQHLDSGLTVPMFQQGEDLIECINKAMAFLSVVSSRQHQSYVGTGNRGIATTSKGNVSFGPPRVVKCYNCQEEGHMARHYTQPKMPRNATWFKEKLMLAEAQKAQILDEE